MKEKVINNSPSTAYAAVKRQAEAIPDWGIIGNLAAGWDGSKKAERIVPLLVRYINLAKLKPGDKMPSEQQLSKEIGVGRRALRESLICLQSVGLVQSRQGMGWYVEHFDPSTSLRFLSPLLQDFGGASLIQVIQTRLAIEPIIGQLAAEHISEAGMQELHASLEVMEKNVDNSNLETFRIHDQKFHDILAQECGNCILSMVSSILTGLFYSVRWDLPQDNKAHVLEQHQIIFEAVRNHDGPLAIQAIQKHLEEAMAYIDQHYQTNRLSPDETGETACPRGNGQSDSMDPKHLHPG